MKKSIVRASALALAVCSMATIAASCKKKTPADSIDKNYEWLDASLTDSSQLSDYEGQNRMELKAWNISQTGGFKQYNSSNDVVTEEIERVTGVKIKEWYDNAGSAADVAYDKLLSTNDIPEIAYGRGWVEPEDVYDLTELIDEYCPTIKARMPKSVWNDTQVNAGEKGKVYGIPYGLGNMSLADIDPEADPAKTSMFQFNNEPYPYIVVRDDILTQAYPDAKTADEIDALFAQNGKFTEADLFDVPITSAAQFRTEFLPRIQAVIDNDSRYTMQNGEKVRAMMATDGSDYDTWSFLGVLIPKLLGGAGTHTNTQFSYWDKSTQKVELMLTQDWYLNEVEEWAKLLKDGKYVTTKEFTSKHQELSGLLNTGAYAIGYQSSCLPSGNQAQYTPAGGSTETVRYRKVYMKIPIADQFEFFASGAPAVNTVMFFKDTVDEDKLPQLLRWLDYQCSRLADKVYAWGPSSAGLFNEADGVRTYKDEALANQMVYSTATMGDLVQKYNLSNGTVTSAQPVFSFGHAAISISHPKCSYDLSSLNGLAESQFSSAIVCSEPKPVGLAKFPSLHQWTEADFEGIGKIWGKRKSIEDKLKAILLSGGGSTFDTAVNDMKSTLETNGWTDEYFNGAYTNRFLALNEDFLEQFYQG